MVGINTTYIRHLCRCLIAGENEIATIGKGKKTAETVLIIGSSLINPINEAKNVHIMAGTKKKLNFFL